MANYKLVLCYEGTRYKGWQKQGNASGTIQEKMETLLSRMLEQPVKLAASGRTDAGVHARYQVCSFRADTERACDALLSELRAHLPEDIGAISLEPAPPRFHARLSCTGKTYVYRIWNSASPNVFQRRFMLQVTDRLDTDAMRCAAAHLIGKHDFLAFSSLKNSSKSTVRELQSIEIVQEGEELRLYFTGDGFLYNMVRILVGTLLEAGKGAISAEEMPAILASRDRKNAGPTAPACGLTLWDVRYRNFDGEQARER